MDVSPSICHVIGDTLVDMEAAWNVGAKAWAVACGKPELPAAHSKQLVTGNYEMLRNFADILPAINNANTP